VGHAGNAEMVIDQKKRHWWTTGEACREMFWQKMVCTNCKCSQKFTFSYLAFQLYPLPEIKALLLELKVLLLLQTFQELDKLHVRARPLTKKTCQNLWTADADSLQIKKIWCAKRYSG